MTLYPYQREGAAFLASSTSKGVLLADEPGLGKTRQAIAAAHDIIVWTPGLEWSVRIVCPASAVGVWRKEIAAFANPHILWMIESFNKAGSDPSPFSVLIIDEAHYTKTRDSQRTQALFGEKCDGVGGLVERAEKVILLTGTPTPNNPSEIWPMARACFPEAVMIHPPPGTPGTPRPMAYWSFVSKFCVVEQNYLGHQKIVGGKNLLNLRKRLAPYVLRRKKLDVLADLPEVRFDVLPIEGKIKWTPGLDLELAAVALMLKRKGVDGLRAAAPHVASLRRVTGLAKVAGVMDWVEEWFAGGGGKLVLFAHHREVIALLEVEFGERAYVVGGHTRPVDRATIADKFNKDPRQNIVFLGQNEAAGTGLTLSGASTLLSLEPAWTPGINDQIWQRIHRIGQKNACMVYYPTIAGSIDEDVSRALIPKQGAIDALWN